MTLTYEPGHRNQADYMSRQPNNVPYTVSCETHWCMENGQTTNTDPNIKLYCDIKDDLTITQKGIILRSHRICRTGDPLDT